MRRDSDGRDQSHLCQLKADYLIELAYEPQSWISFTDKVKESENDAMLQLLV